VDAEKAKKAQRAKNGSPSITPASTGSPAPPSAASSKPYTGDTEKRHFKLDKVNISRTGNALRDNCIGMLYNGLAYRSNDSVEDVLTRAIEVENAAFKAYKGDGQDYRSKTRGLFTALKNKTNRQLGRKVMAGEIPADRFVVMTTQELASAEQRAKDEALEKENMKKAQVPMAEKSISDALKCGKCGQKKVSYSQAQTRSADEPMTTFCECTVCGNRWKVSSNLIVDACLTGILTIQPCSSLNGSHSPKARSTSSTLLLAAFHLLRARDAWIALVTTALAHPKLGTRRFATALTYPRPGALQLRSLTQLSPSQG
jgi:transcription elongation factor S-II